MASATEMQNLRDELARLASTPRKEVFFSSCLTLIRHGKTLAPKERR